MISFSTIKNGTVREIAVWGQKALAAQKRAEVAGSSNQKSRQKIIKYYKGKENELKF